MTTHPRVQTARALPAPVGHAGARTHGDWARGQGARAPGVVFGDTAWAQHNPVIHAFYTRLRAAGKPPKVARCAAARKLLPIVWAGVAKDQDVDPTY